MFYEEITALRSELDLVTKTYFDNNDLSNSELVKTAREYEKRLCCLQKASDA